MGYERHHAIVVTSWDRVLIDRAHAYADEAGCKVTNIVSGTVNDQWTFCAVPDGSKEGWPDSDDGDRARAALRTFLWSLRYDDDSTSIDFVEVQFGDDMNETKVVADSDEPYRQRWSEGSPSLGAVVAPSGSGRG